MNKRGRTLTFAAGIFLILFGVGYTLHDRRLRMLSEPVSNGVFLDTILVTFKPGADQKNIDAVAQAIHGKVVRVNADFNTYVFDIPARKTFREMVELSSYIKKFPDVEYTNLAVDTYDSNTVHYTVE